MGTSAVLRRDRGQEAAPAVQVQDRNIGEFQNHNTGVNLILSMSCRNPLTPRVYATIGLTARNTDLRLSLPARFMQLGARLLINT